MREEYTTKEWRDLSNEVISESGSICHICKENEATVAHHLTYTQGILCDKRFLIAVCTTCHNKVHGYDPDHRSTRKNAPVYMVKVGRVYVDIRTGESGMCVDDPWVSTYSP